MNSKRLNLSLAIKSGVALLAIGAAALTVTAQKSFAANKSNHYWMKFKAGNAEERSKVANMGVSIETIVDDSVMAIGNEKNLEQAKASGMLLMSLPLKSNKLDFPQEDKNFHNYERLSAELKALADKYPKLITLGTIGKSLEGREMYLLTYSTDGKDMTRPAVFFMGGHHAREHVSVETPLNLAKYLAEKYTAGDERIVKLLSTRTVYIVPVVNPDGAEYDVASGEYQLWRKNRRNNGDGSMGVDLNRNYGYGWGGDGASASPDDETYRGAKAFSEPETQNVKAFFDSHSNITIDLTFHTFSELILYPWGHTNEQIADAKAYAVHKTMAETMAKWNHYTPEQASDLYITSGDTTDWAFGTHGIISFTFELDPKMMFDASRGFYPGQDFIMPVFQKNLEPCLYLIEYADNPYRVLDKTGPAYGLAVGTL